MALRKTGFKRKYCYACQGPKAEADRATGLRQEKQMRWRRVLARMRRRGFKRIGISDAEGRRRWKVHAIAALRQTTDLDAWEAEYAPKGIPGPRPGRSKR